MDMKAERDRIHWLLDTNNLSQTWLINRLAVKGLNVSSANMTNALRGCRKNETAKAIITASLEVLEDYQKWAEGA